MTKTGKIITAVIGTLVVLIAIAIIIIATFDWNRLKPTINEKVSTELNRPFAIRGDLGVVWERQKQETGWRSWIPWPHVHAEDVVLGNPPDIPAVTMVHLPRVEATLAPLALLTKTVYLPWIKFQQPDARLCYERAGEGQELRVSGEVVVSAGAVDRTRTQAINDAATAKTRATRSRPWAARSSSCRSA